MATLYVLGQAGGKVCDDVILFELTRRHQGTHHNSARRRMLDLWMYT